MNDPFREEKGIQRHFPAARCPGVGHQAAGRLLRESPASEGQADVGTFQPTQCVMQPPQGAGAYGRPTAVHRPEAEKKIFRSGNNSGASGVF